MNKILELTSKFDKIKHDNLDPTSGSELFLSEVHLSLSNLAVSFKSSFTELKIHKCKSMYKFDHDLFKAIFQAFKFGIDVYIFFKHKVDAENNQFQGHLNSMKKMFLKFLKTFLHKTGKRVSLVVQNTYGLKEHLRPNRLKLNKSVRNETKLLKKNILLMIIDLYFFEKFVDLIVNNDDSLMHSFRNDLRKLFESILEIIKSEKLRIPKEMFFVIQYFFKIYIILIADNWEKFVPIFCQFVELMIYFENKNDFNNKLKLFKQIKKNIELYDFTISADSEKLIGRKYDHEGAFIHFKSRQFQRFFESNFLNKKSKIIYSILKESFQLMERLVKSPSVSLERYSHSFFLLLEHYILKFLDNTIMVKLNHLMNFLKFLCDQLLDFKNYVSISNIVISKKNNKIVSSLFSNVCDESSHKKKKRKVSEAICLVKGPKIGSRKRNLTEIKKLAPLLPDHSIDISSNNESESFAQGNFCVLLISRIRKNEIEI